MNRVTKPARYRFGRRCPRIRSWKSWALFSFLFAGWCSLLLLNWQRLFACLVRCCKMATSTVCCSSPTASPHCHQSCVNGQDACPCLPTASALPYYLSSESSQCLFCSVAAFSHQICVDFFAPGCLALTPTCSSTHPAIYWTFCWICHSNYRNSLNFSGVSAILGFLLSYHFCHLRSHLCEL